VAASTDTGTQTAEHELVVTRLIDAPRRLVFKAWTEAGHAANWWGPKGFTSLGFQMDVRVGGRFRCGMRSPQGTDHWKVGTYREIVEPERIVFSFAWEDATGKPGHELLTTVTFADAGTKTRLTLRQTQFTTAAWRDDHGRGWTSTLERLAEYLTTAPPGG
jgi:uncharacterized protein YndB with AHSA1/START domain